MDELYASISSLEPQCVVTLRGRAESARAYCSRNVVGGVTRFLCSGSDRIVKKSTNYIEKIKPKCYTCT